MCSYLLHKHFEAKVVGMRNASSVIPADLPLSVQSSTLGMAFSGVTEVGISIAQLYDRWLTRARQWTLGSGAKPQQEELSTDCSWVCATIGRPTRSTNSKRAVPDNRHSQRVVYTCFHGHIRSDLIQK